MNTRVLVTDGEHRAALAVVRSLGHAGYDPIVVSPRRRPLAGASRHARAVRIAPDPLSAPVAFVDALRRIAKLEDVRVLIPTTEAAALAVLGARDKFPEIVIPLPDFRTFSRLCDKDDVLRTAAHMGINVPAQVVIADRSEGERLDLDRLTYPVVLKPSRSIGAENGHKVRQGVSYAANADALRSKLRALSAAAYPLLLQQRIVGHGVGIFVLRWNERIIASFSHQRLREKPPAGGVSVYAESIDADPGLLKQSVELLSAFDWNGAAMVEYKIETTTGTPFLMEVNGRFWGSLQLAVDAGVDFPALLVRAALGETVNAVRDYQIGTRTRWWWGDVDHVLARVRHRREDLALGTDAPTTWQTLRSFFNWRRADRSEILRWDDPRPFLRESLQWFSRR